MKKILSLLLAVLVMTAVFASCTGGATSSDTSSSAVDSSSEAVSSSSDESAVSSSDVSSSSAASSESVASSSSAVVSSSVPASSSSKPASSSSKPASSSSGSGFVLGNNAWGTTFANPMDAWPGVDISAAAHVVVYMISNQPPPDMDMVIAKLNEKFKHDINTTVEFIFTPNNSLNTKYPLLVLSNTKGDAIQQMGNSTNLPNLARQGGYKELTVDMLKKYMPRVWAKHPAEAWSKTKVDGKMYLIPGITPNKSIQTMMLRGDMIKKYNLATPQYVKDLAPYFAAIKSAGGTLKPMSLRAGDIDSLFRNATGQRPPNGAGTFVTTQNGGINGMMADDNGNLYNDLEGEHLDLFKANANVIKSWYDAGYINKDVMQNTAAPATSFGSGASALYIGNSINVQSAVIDADAKGWDPTFVPVLPQGNKASLAAWDSNGMALFANTKNAERAMMVLDLLMEDVQYNLLAYYGIEGYHYVINDKGYLDVTPALQANADRYKVDVAGFWWTDKDQFPKLATWSEKYAQYLDKYVNQPGTFRTPALQGFTLDTTGVIKTEAANMSAAGTQYGGPITIGAVSNVDEAIAQLVSKLKAAGYDKVFAEAQRQIAAWKATQ